MMKRTIWKFPVTVTDEFTIEMPRGAHMLAVQTQGGVPFLWALVDPEAELEQVGFRVFGTGHDATSVVDPGAFYVGTFQMQNGGLVFHLYCTGRVDA